jgi:hypothetical protein
MNRLYAGCLVVAIATFITRLAFAGLQNFTDLEVQGHRVRLSLLGSDRTTKSWPDERPRLTVSSVTVKPDDTIHSLLIGNKIRPDIEAFTLVYELNPQVQSLKSLKAGTTLLLPLLQPGPKLSAELEAGFKVALTVDPDVKDTLGRNTQVLTTIFPVNATLTPSKVANGVSVESSGQAARYVVNRLEFFRRSIIRRNGRPVTRETLEQLIGDAETMTALLTPVMKGERRLTADDARQIVSIQKDIKIKETHFVQVAAGEPPDAWPKVKIVVRTIKQGKPVSGLRVYYVPEALKTRADQVRPFDTLSSPCERKMPEADYIIWASKDNNSKPISVMQRLIVRKESTTGPVDLAIR